MHYFTVSAMLKKVSVLASFIIQRTHRDISLPLYRTFAKDVNCDQNRAINGNKTHTKYYIQSPLGVWYFLLDY